MPVIAVSAECRRRRGKGVLLSGTTDMIPTQYDRRAIPQQRCHRDNYVRTRFREPRIHKNFPAGRRTEILTQEVVSGIHDHWIDPPPANDLYLSSAAVRLLPRRRPAQSQQPPALPAGQSNRLHRRCPGRLSLYRRAQAITWIRPPTPKQRPPCLQRLCAA